MKKAAVLVCMASVLLSGCSGAGGEKVSQTADSCAQAVASELAKTDWAAVSTDANSEDAAYVMAHTDTVALDRLIAFTLTADGGPSEGACEELRSRFLESPHIVLAYLVLMGIRRYRRTTAHRRQSSSAGRLPRQMLHGMTDRRSLHR